MDKFREIYSFTESKVVFTWKYLDFVTLHIQRTLWLSRRVRRLTLPKRPLLEVLSIETRTVEVSAIFYYIYVYLSELVTSDKLMIRY